MIRFIFHLLTVGIVLSQDVDDPCSVKLSISTDELSKNDTVTCEIIYNPTAKVSGLFSLYHPWLPGIFPLMSTNDEGKLKNQTLPTTWKLEDKSEISKNKSKFVLEISNTYCRDEFDFQCLCETDDKSFTYNTAKGITAHPRMKMIGTTPFRTRWRFGVDETNFVGARCIGSHSAKSEGELRWILHRKNQMPEIVRRDDPRISLMRRENFTGALIPENRDGDTKFTHPCTAIVYSSSISFRASDRDNSLSIECQIKLSRFSSSSRIYAEARTPPLYVRVPVTRANTEASLLKDGNVVICISRGNPPPSYTWFSQDNPKVVLNESTGPQPAYLRLKTLTEEELTSINKLRCAVTNKVSGTTYKANVQVEIKKPKVPRQPASAYSTTKMSTSGWIQFITGTAAGIGMLILVVSAYVLSQKDYDPEGKSDIICP